MIQVYRNVLQPDAATYSTHTKKKSKKLKPKQVISSMKNPIFKILKKSTLSAFTRPALSSALKAKINTIKKALNWKN